METPLVISIISKGTPEYPRYVIGNQVQVWTGTEWSLDEPEGLLYGSESDARNACVSMSDFESKPSYRFTCPLQARFGATLHPISML